MARAGHGLHLEDRGRVRGEAAGLRIEGELEDLVGAQRGNVDESVRRVDADGMGVASHRDHLQRLGGDAPVAADRVHADEMGGIGRTEQEAPGPVERYIRKALRERRARQELQGPRRGIDRVGVHRIRFGARRRVEKSPVGAHRHGHDHARRLRARTRLKLAVGRHAVGADVAVLGVRDVDERSRERRRAAGQPHECPHGDPRGQSSEACHQPLTAPAVRPAT